MVSIYDDVYYIIQDIEMEYIDLNNLVDKIHALQKINEKIKIVEIDKLISLFIYIKISDGIIYFRNNVKNKNFFTMINVFVKFLKSINNPNINEYINNIETIVDKIKMVDLIKEKILSLKKVSINDKKFNDMINETKIHYDDFLSINEISCILSEENKLIDNILQEEIDRDVVCPHIIIYNYKNNEEQICFVYNKIGKIFGIYFRKQLINIDYEKLYDKWFSVEEFIKDMCVSNENSYPQKIIKYSEEEDLIKILDYET